MLNAITAVPGIQVGHATDLEGLTGCTVILCPEGAVVGVDVRGSAYGLASATGVMQWLEERGIGLPVGGGSELYDGHTLFALSCGDQPGDVTAIGTAAALAVERAVLRAVITAHAAGGLPAHADLSK